MESVLVIGGSSGIGLACARKLAQHTPVILCARSEEGLRSAVEGFSSAQTVGMKTVDITDSKQRKALIAELPKLKGLVYSAGGNRVKPVQFIDEAFVAEMTAVHLEAPLLLLQGLLHARKLVSGSSVVWISSVAGLRGSYGNSVYAAVKGGLAAAVPTLALELAKLDIRINAVAPGLVDTPLTERIFLNLPPEARLAAEQKHPLGMPSTEAVAETIAFLMSAAACSITGATIPVDGGYLAG